jgi:hypothetical protein
MPAAIEIYADADLTQPLDAVELAEASTPSLDTLGIGEPSQIFIYNSGTTTLRDLEVQPTGLGGSSVQLAPDDDGEPGGFADRGQPITVHLGSLYPGQTFAFWARGAYALEDLEDRQDFDLLVTTLSGGG